MVMTASLKETENVVVLMAIGCVQVVVATGVIMAVAIYTGIVIRLGADGEYLI